MLWLTKQFLKSKDPAKRRKAAEELCQQITANPRAADSLMELLDDSDAEIRCMAVAALGKSDDPRRPDVVRRAIKDSNPEVAKAALAFAKRLKEDDVLDLMVPLLQHHDFGVRGGAASVLDAFKWKPAGVTEEMLFAIARGQMQRAITFGPEAVTALETVLKTAPYSVQVSIVDALGRVDDPRVAKPIVAAVKSPEAAVCVAAVDALARLGMKENWEDVASVLRHQDARVRTAAVEALGKLAEPQSVAAVSAMMKDSHWDVRRAAAESLGRLRDRSAVPALTQALNDEDADVRESAAFALGSIRERSAIAPLIMALKDPNSSVRRIVAAALARIEEDWSSSSEATQAFEQLKVALQESSIEVRHSLGKLLSGGAPKPAPTAAAPTQDSRQQLAVTLLTQILGDFDRDLRQAAAEALGRLGGRAAESALVRALRDSDPGVQSAAEKALRNFGDARSTRVVA